MNFKEMDTIITTMSLKLKMIGIIEDAVKIDQEWIEGRLINIERHMNLKKII